MAKPVKLDLAEAAARAKRDLPRWTIADGRLRRVYETGAWKNSLTIVGAIGCLAKSAWHHPDLAVSFGRVIVELSTHDADGLTERDFALASRIEAVVAWRPDADGPFDAPIKNRLIRDDG